MNDAATMRIVQRVANLPDDAKCRFNVHTAGVIRIEDVSQCSTLEPLQDEEIEIPVTVEVDKAHDVRMHETPRLGCLLL